ncbi:MAG: AI-2E family transporter, partial [Porphyromonadaceae bacterium]|nr:AI-2E family transporter [Porphyromonadaceae bacterium]
MKQYLSRPFTLDRTVRMLLLIVLLVLLIWTLSAIWSVILPFLLAGIFAYVMMPIVRFFQYRLRLRYRGLAVLLTFVLLGGLIWLGLIYIVPSVREEVEKTLSSISSYNGGQDILKRILPPELRRYFEGSFNFGRLSRGVSFEQVIENTKIIIDQAGSIISGTLSVFSWGFVFLVGLMYFI